MMIMPRDAVLFIFIFFLKDMTHSRVDIVNFSERVLRGFWGITIVQLKSKLGLVSPL